jgi:hypothetical protein
MKNDYKILTEITHRFPNHKNFIKELFNESESFKVLCEDYYDCKNVLDKSIEMNNKTSDLRKEYKMLLSEIEDELLERLSI